MSKKSFKNRISKYYDIGIHCMINIRLKGQLKLWQQRLFHVKNRQKQKCETM